MPVTSWHAACHGAARNPIPISSTYAKNVLRMSGLRLRTDPRRHARLDESGRLKIEHVGVPSTLGDQLVVTAVLDDGPFVEHDNSVRPPHRREAVRDQD